MGGWRCSYRNCTAKSDGKTHMFHYPVFDKVRCHQWLVNSGRLDFLNLKVSQLKNRVVCQYHFKDEFFMNFKKDKLTFNAVPTLPGPFQDKAQKDDADLIAKSNMYSILFDDIENEYMTLNDKLANYSVRYGDFLTNNDLIEIDISNIPAHNEISNKTEFWEEQKPYEVQTQGHKSKDDQVQHICHDTNNIHNNSSTPDVKKYPTQPVLIVPPYNNNYRTEEVIPIEVNLPPNFFDKKALHVCNDGSYLLSQKSTNETQPTPPPQPPVGEKKKSKVRILSEKKISEPVHVTGKIEPISPSSVIPTVKMINSDVTKENPQSSIEDGTLPGSKRILLNNTLLKQSKLQSLEKSIKNYKSVESSKAIETSPKKSLLKSKITPERVAAIKEKREFNMKLRDIIESLFDKLDDQYKVDVQDKKNTKSVKLQKKGEKQNIASLLNTQPPVATTSNTNDFTIVYLEERMKKMEETLLERIDQNSQKITGLQNTIKQQKLTKKKHISTQTTGNEECQKKRLYQEISKYLSPDANNLIYEELFINKYSQKVPKSFSPKRKRAR